MGTGFDCGLSGLMVDSKAQLELVCLTWNDIELGFEYGP